MFHNTLDGQHVMERVSDQNQLGIFYWIKLALVVEALEYPQAVEVEIELRSPHR